MEKFITILDLNLRALALCIFRATGEESTNDKFIYLFFICIQLVWGNPADWVDRRMGFIIMLAPTRSPELAVNKSALRL